MNMEWGWDNGRAILGLFVITGIAWLLSENKRKFPWKIVVGAVAMMYAFTLLLFGVPIIRAGLDGVNSGINVLIAATREGTAFVFGPVIGDQAKWEQLVGTPGPIFIFQLLPLVIVIGSLSAILWHWGILKVITNGFAFMFQRTMGMGGPTSLSVAANIFMGQTEAPLLIKPYLKVMTRSELLIVMATGFATIAGSVLVVYVTLLRDTLPAVAAHLITVSIIASPAAVALAMVMIPETEATSKSSGETDFKYHSTMDAFASGATDGIAIIWNIATMLIAALALVYIANALLGAIPITINWNGVDQRLSLDMILGWMFAPLMYMAGVPMQEAAQAGTFVGQKTVFTEFVAFINLGNLPADAMTERTRTIVTYAICGFANFGSMGILIGGLSIMCPERRPDFLSLAWKTLFSGTLATIMAAAVVGSLPYGLFKTADVPPPAPAVTIQPADVIPEPAPSSPITTPAPAPETAPAQPTQQTP
ncbi:MAG: nucleoside transporter C-terminal domain-containing protein [Hyphomonadaceae bacterium]|nr:nucleoside transporter C-terminal domain-containing protein [Hyphomonadaceae bacterium]